MYKHIHIYTYVSIIAFTKLNMQSSSKHRNMMHSIEIIDNLLYSNNMGKSQISEMADR